MDAKIEQRTVLHFLSCAGKSPIECWREMTTVFGAETMSKNRIRVWHKRFCDSRTSFKDDKHTGRPKSFRSPGNIRRVQRCLQTDQCVTVRQLAEETNISKSSVHTILKKDLGLSKLAPKLVPKVLTQEQKDFRVRLCRENLELLRQRPDVLDFVIMGDESWISVLEVETKQASSVWIPKGSNAPRPAKARRQRVERKTMLTTFFDKKGVVLAEFLPLGETVDTDQYLETLRRLKECIRKKRPALWSTGRGRRVGPRPFIIHHDNASSHTSAPTLAFFGEQNINMLAHPPYSPDLAPCDYFLFPRLKNELRGIKHRNIEDLKEGVRRVLRNIPSEDFENAIMSMPICWMKCVSAGGEYFEGRHLPFDPADHSLEIVFGEGSELEESSSEEGQNSEAEHLDSD